MRFIRFILNRFFQWQELKRRDKVNRINNTLLRDEVEGYRRFMRSLANMEANSRETSEPY